MHKMDSGRPDPETAAMLDAIRQREARDEVRRDMRRRLSEIDIKAGKRDTEFRAKLVPLYSDGKGNLGRARAIEMGCPALGFRSPTGPTESAHVHVAHVDWGTGGGRSYEAWCGAIAWSPKGAPKRWGRMQAGVTCPDCVDLIADQGTSARYTCM